MLVYENDCVGCPAEMGCLGRACPYTNVPHFYCDSCEAEAEEFYEYEGEYFCKDCFLEIALEGAEKYTAEELINKGG